MLEEEAQGRSDGRYCCVCTCDHVVVRCSGMQTLHQLCPLTVQSPLAQTDFTTGPFAITVVLKLNGSAGVVSLEPFGASVALPAATGLKLKANFVGLRRA